MSRRNARRGHTISPAVTSAPIIAASSVVKIGATITWAAVPGASGYTWFRNGVSAGAVTSPLDVSFGDIGPTLTLKANNAAGSSPASNALSFAGVESLLAPKALLDERGQTVVSTSVSAWLDESIANTLVTFVNGGVAPTASTINGHAAPHFDGTSTMQSAHKINLATGSGAFDILVVIDTTGETRAADNATVYQQGAIVSGDVARKLIACTTSGLQGAALPNGSGTWTKTAYHQFDEGVAVVRFTYDGSALLAISANGDDPTTAAFTGAVDTGDTTYTRLAANFNATHFWPGKIGEVVMRDSQLSTNDWLTTLAFLSWKFGAMMEV